MIIKINRNIFWINFMPFLKTRYCPIMPGLSLSYISHVGGK